MQSLVQVLESCAANLRCHSMILFQDLLVSTTLSPDDTVNLFTFAVMRLTSQALLSSDASSWSHLRKGTGSSETSSRSTSAPVGSIDSMHHVIRPLQNDKWKKGKDGFLITDIWGLESGGSPDSANPTVWLQQTQERVYLLAYQYKSLTSLLLLPKTDIVHGGLSAVKQQVIEQVSTSPIDLSWLNSFLVFSNIYTISLLQASLRIMKIEEKISRGWGGENAYHVKGYRYLVVDTDLEVSRASPSGKVATLAKVTSFTL